MQFTIIKLIRVLSVFFLNKFFYMCMASHIKYNHEKNVVVIDNLEEPNKTLNESNIINETKTVCLESYNRFVHIYNLKKPNQENHNINPKISGNYKYSDDIIRFVFDSSNKSLQKKAFKHLISHKTFIITVVIISILIIITLLFLILKWKSYDKKIFEQNIKTTIILFAFLLIVSFILLTVLFIQIKPISQNINLLKCSLSSTFFEKINDDINYPSHGNYNKINNYYKYLNYSIDNLNNNLFKYIKHLSSKYITSKNYLEQSLFEKNVIGNSGYQYFLIFGLYSLRNDNGRFYSEFTNKFAIAFKPDIVDDYTTPSIYEKAKIEYQNMTTDFSEIFDEIIPIFEEINQKITLSKIEDIYLMQQNLTSLFKYFFESNEENSFISKINNYLKLFTKLFKINITGLFSCNLLFIFLSILFYFHLERSLNICSYLFQFEKYTYYFLITIDALYLIFLAVLCIFSGIFISGASYAKDTFNFIISEENLLSKNPKFIDLLEIEGIFSSYYLKDIYYLLNEDIKLADYYEMKVEIEPKKILNTSKKLNKIDERLDNYTKNIVLANFANDLDNYLNNDYYDGKLICVSNKNINFTINEYVNKLNEFLSSSIHCQTNETNINEKWGFGYPPKNKLNIEGYTYYSTNDVSLHPPSSDNKVYLSFEDYDNYYTAISRYNDFKFCELKKDGTFKTYKEAIQTYVEIIYNTHTANKNVFDFIVATTEKAQNCYIDNISQIKSILQEIQKYLTELENLFNLKENEAEINWDEIFPNKILENIKINIEFYYSLVNDGIYKKAYITNIIGLASLFILVLLSLLIVANYGIILDILNNRKKQLKSIINNNAQNVKIVNYIRPFMNNDNLKIINISKEELNNKGIDNIYSRKRKNNSIDNINSQIIDKKNNVTINNISQYKISDVSNLLIINK